MTILTELARLYDRLEKTGDAPPQGFSSENIGGEVVLDEAGNVLAIRDLRVADEKGKLRARKMAVPAAVKRSVNITPNAYWDKSAYVLGVTLLKDAKGKPMPDENGHLTFGQEKRTLQEHAAFVQTHKNLLAEANDLGLQALRGFILTWQPDMFGQNAYPPDLLDENLVFRLNGDTAANGQPRYIHERAAARHLLEREPSGGEETALCLVSGTIGATARLHPSIKGVMGAQSSGASLVAFNAAAYESFGKTQGENAPVSQSAAFAYGTALNVLLAKGSGRNLRIGDSTVVFWAETADVGAAQSIEGMLFGALNPPDKAAETNTLRATLESIATGRTADPKFAPETRVFILGLAPNAARLSVRFWLPATLGDFARNVTRFWADLALDPPAWPGPPAAWSLLYEVAAQRKAENIPPRLGGELMQAVLRGTPYPRTLLSGVIQRIRADGDINRKRVAIITAHIRRNLAEKEFPMSLDRDNPNPAYRLGRLFAVLEGIQLKALPGLNATIKDRYFAAASATPARVFPLLVKTATHHLSKLRKGDSGGLAHWFDAEMGAIWAGLEADMPRALNLEDQGRFIAGYYHQRWAKKGKTDNVIDNGSTET